ncbi:MAG: hypothetical protein K5756_05790 [Clostridiales bacterium]|nr:hypothetical protein [Clostridiales bacterium]
MKTLLIYFSDSETIKNFCSNSKDKDIDTVEIYEKYDRGFVVNKLVSGYKSIVSQGVCTSQPDIDFSKYSSVVIAASMQMFCVPAAINDFLHRNYLNGKDIYGIIFGNNMFRAASEDMQRKIGLAGGICKGVVCVKESEIRKNECDVRALLKKKALN